MSEQDSAPGHKRQVLLLRVALLLTLAPFLLLTAFNQPFFDDFRNAYWTREHGLTGVQTWLYQTWTGRYTSTVFMTVLSPVTHGWLDGVKVAAALFFVAQWASITHFIRVLLHTALRVACSWSTAFWVAGLLLALFCNAAPAPFSFLYWYCGAVAYQLPLIGLLNFIALALRASYGPGPQRRACTAWACLALVFALVGNELTLVQALPVLALLGWLLPPAARPKWWLWLAVGTLATLPAVVAPGNWVRVQAMAPTTDALHAYRWLVLLPRSVHSLGYFLLRPLIAVTQLAAAGTGWWLGVWQRRRNGGQLVAVSRAQWRVLVLAFVALNFGGFVLFRYITVGAPLMRAQNEILLVMLISGGMLAWLLGQQGLGASLGSLRFRAGSGLLPVAALVALFALGHVPEAWRELLSSAASFDAQMHARFAALRAAHQQRQAVATVPRLRLPYGRVLIPLRQFSYDIEFDIDLSPGCDGTINEVMKSYFEVPRVCTDSTAQQPK